jgi:hypothetical protein
MLMKSTQNWFKEQHLGATGQMTSSIPSKCGIWSFNDLIYLWTRNWRGGTIVSTLQSSRDKDICRIRLTVKIPSSCSAVQKIFSKCWWRWWKLTYSLFRTNGLIGPTMSIFDTFMLPCGRAVHSSVSQTCPRHTQNLGVLGKCRFFFIFLDRVSLYSPGWPRTPNPPASAFHVLVYSCSDHAWVKDAVSEFVD